MQYSLCVCLLVTTVCCSVGALTVRPVRCVLNGGLYPPMGRDTFEGCLDHWKAWSRIQFYGLCKRVKCAKMVELTEVPFAQRTRLDPMSHPLHRSTHNHHRLANTTEWSMHGGQLVVTVCITIIAIINCMQHKQCFQGQMICMITQKALRKTAKISTKFEQC